MSDSKDYEMTRAEFDALREGATPFWYGGDRRTIVSFSARPEGLDVSLTSHETDDGPQMSTLISWKEFAEITADMPFIMASGVASRESGRSVHIGRPTADGRDVR